MQRAAPRCDRSAALCLQVLYCFEIPAGAKNLPILGFAGFLIAFSWKEYFAPATITAALGGHWGNLVARFILWFFVVAVWPVFIQKWAEK